MHRELLRLFRGSSRDAVNYARVGIETEPGGQVRRDQEAPVRPLEHFASVGQKSSREPKRKTPNPPSCQATRQLRLVWLNLNAGSHCVNRALVRRLRVMYLQTSSKSTKEARKKKKVGSNFERLGLVNLGALKDDACFPAIRRLAKLRAPSRRAHSH